MPFARDEVGKTVGSPDAAQDLYGLGVRIGFYLQGLGMVLYNYGSKDDYGKGLKLASGGITISILASWFVFAMRGQFSPSEAIIVLLILMILSFPAKTTLLNPRTIAGEITGLIALLMTEMGTCAALLWLFARLVVTLPHFGTDNVVFFFGNVSINGWFRYVALVYSVIDAATSLRFAYKVSRLINVALQIRASSDFDEAIIDAIVDWKDMATWIKCLHWLTWVLVVIAIELTVQWNHLSPSINLQSPGQLIPLVAGIIILADSTFVAGRHVYPRYVKPLLTQRRAPAKRTAQLEAGLPLSTVLAPPKKSSQSAAGLPLSTIQTVQEPPRKTDQLEEELPLSTVHRPSDAVDIRVRAKTI